MLTRLSKSWLAAALLCVPLAGQEQFASKTPTVTMLRAPLATVQRGGAHPVELHFRVGPGFMSTPTRRPKSF